MLFRKQTARRVAVMAALAVMSSSCAIFSTDKRELSEDEACVKLNALLDDHANNFEHFRGARKSENRLGNMQIWNAERVFPLAKNCQVWEWSTGLTNYFCSWKESDEIQAKVSHGKGVDIVNRCLNDKWQSNFVNTLSGGGRTLFYQDGSKTVISVRYFKESRTILQSWKTTLYVGDESNLNVEVQ